MPQTIDQLWVWILAAAAPIAGVVGFALNLGQLKRSRLENEKLRLEVEALRAAQAAKEQRVVPATLDEVTKYGQRHMPPPMPDFQGPLEAARRPGGLAVVIFVVLVLLLFWLFK